MPERAGSRRIDNLVVCIRLDTHAYSIGYDFPYDYRPARKRFLIGENYSVNDQWLLNALSFRPGRLPVA